MTPVRRYRLRMSRLNRVFRTVLFVVIGVSFAPSILDGGLSWSLRLFGVVGVLSSVYGLRIILGSAIEVRPQGLRLLNRWPVRRDIPWYRILEVDIIPGYWLLDVELNSGETLSLPCVEDVDDLYERVEELRQKLDV